ncbi:MAG TPA: ChaN family lipoprotein [Telmatospirillum sp.]|nr:ChaN family lipoprotein [Telmatospirillum sp.]
MHRLFAALLLIIVLPACADTASSPWRAPLAQNHPLVGRIWLTGPGRFVDETDLATHLSEADFVLLGERHDNPDHHRLQTWALTQIVAAGRRPVVAFEMISPEQAPALQRHLQDHPGDVAGLAEALDWQHGNWPDWLFYQPLFAVAIQANLPLRAANLPQGTLRTIVRGQPLPVETQRFYRLDQALAPALVTAMAEEIRQSHCRQLPERAIAPMVDVQRARDAAMAHAMADDTPNGGLLIAGAGHTRTDRGVPMQLAALAPRRTIFSLAFVEVADEQTDPAAYGEAFGAPELPFDAIWFTPRASDDDPCAEMINFMKKKTEKEQAGEKNKE